MTSILDQGVILEKIAGKYNDGVIPLDIIGNSSVRNGQHLRYFEEAIKSNPIKLDLNVAPALAEIGVNVTALSGGSGN